MTTVEDRPSAASAVAETASSMAVLEDTPDIRLGETRILGLRTREQAQRLQPRDFEHEIATREEMLHLCGLLEVGWVHSGDPRDPHAETTKGKCTNGYFNCDVFLELPNLIELFARMKRRRVERDDALHRYLHNPAYRIDLVIGSSAKGRTIAHEDAKMFGANVAYTEKGVADGRKQQLWQRRRVPKGSRLLISDDLANELSTTDQIIDGLNTSEIVESSDVEKEMLAPFLLFLINRSGKREHRGMRIISLLEVDNLEVWEPDACPLCAAGSRRLKPSLHWGELIRKT